jgi:glyoxylase-like metal-dependent hydrolase (beta-lactamase superfamily II)
MPRVVNLRGNGAPAGPIGTVHKLSTGRVRPKQRSAGPRRYLPGGWSDTTLPVNAFVIEHRDGLCLFDTGQTALAARAGHLPRWHPFLRLARFELTRDDEAAAQIHRLGYVPGDVRWVVLSHLHTDHVGGLAAFRRAEVVVSRTEWQRAGGLRGRLLGYLPQHWPQDLTPRLVDFDGDAVGPFGRSHDLAGDGSLVLVPTPGHTPGHLSLLVRGHRAWLCAGDMAEDPDHLRAVAPEVDAFCREQQAIVLTAHDPSTLPPVEPAPSLTPTDLP